jgi:peptide/nickel transport system permease protein
MQQNPRSYKYYDLIMAVFVTAFSLLADAARDALDPKLRGLE